MSCPKCERNSLKEEMPGHYRCKVCKWIGPESEVKGKIGKYVKVDREMLGFAIRGTILMAIGLGMIYSTDGWIHSMNCDTDAKAEFVDKCKEMLPFVLQLSDIGKILLPIVAGGMWVMAFLAPKLWKEKEE